MPGHIEKFYQGTDICFTMQGLCPGRPWCSYATGIHVYLQHRIYSHMYPLYYGFVKGFNTILDDQPEAIKAAITQQWIDIQTENPNHKVAERLFSVLSLESNELVKHIPCDFDV